MENLKCIAPKKSYWYGDYTENGKKKILWTPDTKKKHKEEIIYHNCRQCIPCRVRQMGETTARALAEGGEYEKNYMLTLTVDEKYISEIFPEYNLDHRAWQLFMKRYRKNHEGETEIIHPKTGKKIKPIRALMVGEYGTSKTYEQLEKYGNVKGRPHYHALIFNHDFKDKVRINPLEENPLYESEELNKLWTYGKATISEFTHQTALYVIKYVLKKRNGKDYESWDLETNPYTYIDKETGEIKKKKLEYIQFPRGWGLGATFYEKYKNDIYAKFHKGIKLGKKRYPIPSYYNRLLEQNDPELYEKVKELKKEYAIKTEKQNQESPERTWDREEILIKEWEETEKRSSL